MRQILVERSSVKRHADAESERGPAELVAEVIAGTQDIAATQVLSRSVASTSEWVLEPISSGAERRDTLEHIAPHTNRGISP